MRSIIAALNAVTALLMLVSPALAQVSPRFELVHFSGDRYLLTAQGMLPGHPPDFAFSLNKVSESAHLLIYELRFTCSRGGWGATMTGWRTSVAITAPPAIREVKVLLDDRTVTLDLPSTKVEQAAADLLVHAIGSGANVEFDYDKQLVTATPLQLYRLSEDSAGWILQGTVLSAKPSIPRPFYVRQMHGLRRKP